ncbi:myelin-oligodendrocyte glycoprotein-like isoform X7 [Numida meleagris]|uniref:myelin-oligodendrocyte glycoprotein-like isoform X7 n=1 Tax=Numida meleagris TaxID=8996 RepID=UPI000B3D90CE|nr:myelin-oligodendrocyte glycoprotein-like isoform X7 [Numida meleagris]
MRSRSGCNHPSSTPPWRSLLPHLLALLLLHPGSAQIRVVAPGFPITAIVGQDVVLRCHLSPCKDARSLDIRWIQDRSSGLVHHYQDGLDLEQMEEYKGRTELLRNGLSDGNLDLRVTAVTSSDSGSYTCAVQDGADYAEAVVNLEVSDPISQIIHSWTVALAVVVTILLGSFIIIVFLHRKRAAQSRELKTKDAELGRKDEELVIKGAELERKDAELERKDAELKTKEAELGRKNAELERKDEELGIKDAVLERKDAELRRKDAELGIKDAELGRKDAELVSKGAELERKDAELGIKDAELGRKDAELDRKDAELRRKDEELRIKDEEMSKSPSPN